MMHRTASIMHTLSIMICVYQIIISNERNYLLGEQSKLEMSQIVEIVHKGGGGQRQNQNSLHFKCRLTLT